MTIGDQANIALLDEFGVRFVEVANQPLGAKHGAALNLAVSMGGKRFMVLPSDDLISEEWLGVFRASVADYVSPDRCALVDVPSGAAKVLVNRPTGTRSFGAGRFFSVAVVEALGEVWSAHRVSGLDSDSHARIVMAGFPGEVHRCERVPIADLKTGENIWPFGQWNGTPVTMEDALHMAPWVMQALC